MVKSCVPYKLSSSEIQPKTKNLLSQLLVIHREANADPAAAALLKEDIYTSVWTVTNIKKLHVFQAGFPCFSSCLQMSFHSVFHGSFMLFMLTFVKKNHPQPLPGLAHHKTHNYIF